MNKLEIVSRDEWEELLGRSRNLENRIRWARDDGRLDEADALQLTLRKINAKIRNPRLLRVRGIDA